MSKFVLASLLALALAYPALAATLSPDVMTLSAAYHLSTPDLPLPDAQARSVDILCRNNSAMLLSVMLSAVEVTELTGKQPVRSAMDATRENAVMPIKPGQTISIAVDPANVGYKLPANTPFLLHLTFQVTADPEQQVTVEQTIPYIIPSSAREFLFEWVTVNNVQARLHIAVDPAAKATSVIELKNLSDHTIEFTDVPFTTLELTRDGKRVSPSAFYDVDRKYSPFTLPAGATIFFPYGGIGPNATTYWLTVASSEYDELTPGNYALKGTIYVRIVHGAKEVIWELPSFRFTLPPLAPPLK